MFDLQVVAFQADSTRVVTMMMGREGSMRTYPEIGVPDPHHPLTHHRNKPEWIEKVTQVNTFHMELFADFVEKLKATPDGDGTLLDHSIDRLRQRPRDGDRHTHEDLPVAARRRRRRLRAAAATSSYPKDTPMTNLYLTLLDRIGVHPRDSSATAPAGSST